MPYPKSRQNKAGFKKKKRQQSQIFSERTLYRFCRCLGHAPAANQQPPNAQAVSAPPPGSPPQSCAAPSTNSAREIKNPHNAGVCRALFSGCAQAFSFFSFYACRYICPKSESASACISIPSSALCCGFVTSLKWLSQKIPLLPRYIPPLPPSDLRAILALLSNFTCGNLRFCSGRHRFIYPRCLRVVK